MKQLTRLVLAAGTIIATTAAAQAQENADSELVNALLACRTITEDAARTACLDARLADFAEAIETRRLVIVERRVVQSVERDNFGLSVPGMSRLAGLFSSGDSGEQRSAAREESFDDGVTAVYGRDGSLEELRNIAVTRAEYDPLGRVRVTLDNDQVWLQTEDAIIRRITDRHLEGLTATITRGALGSHFMTLSHSPRRFPVRRVQ